MRGSRATSRPTSNAYHYLGQRRLIRKCIAFRPSGIYASNDLEKDVSLSRECDDTQPVRNRRVAVSKRVAAQQLELFAGRTAAPLDCRAHSLSVFRTIAPSEKPHQSSRNSSHKQLPSVCLQFRVDDDDHKLPLLREEILFVRNLLHPESFYATTESTVSLCAVCALHLSIYVSVYLHVCMFPACVVQ